MLSMASLMPMYSAFLVESTAMGCLELFYDTTPPFKVNWNPFINLLSSGSHEYLS